MRVKIAVKKTTCKVCEDAIMPGEARIDEKYQRRDGVGFFTNYYHYKHDILEISCFDKHLFRRLQTIKDRFEKTRQRNRELKAAARDGKFAHLDEEQMGERRKVLNKLANTVRYYEVQDPIDWTPRFPSQMDPREITRATAFMAKIEEYFDLLKDLGGVPSKWVEKLAPHIDNHLELAEHQRDLIRQSQTVE